MNERLVLVYRDRFRVLWQWLLAGDVAHGACELWMWYEVNRSCVATWNVSFAIVAQ